MKFNIFIPDIILKISHMFLKNFNVDCIWVKIKFEYKNIMQLLLTVDLIVKYF